MTGYLPPIPLNNPLVFIGLGGGRRSKLIIPLDLVTEMLESITYSVFCRAEFPKSRHAAARNGRELLPGYCFQVIVLGWISGGNSLGKVCRFPDLGIWVEDPQR